MFCPKGRDFVHNGVSGGGFCSLQVMSLGFVPGRGMVLDEIDTCIISTLTIPMSSFSWLLSSFLDFDVNSSAHFI